MARAGPHANALSHHHQQVTKMATSHPGSLFKFLPKEFALANRVRRVLGRAISYTKLHFSSFHELMNRAKNVDKELLAEPFGDAAMKDRMKTDEYLA